MGWDSKEMWVPFKYDTELMDALAIHWARPLAYGYLPPRYRSHLAGGRLIALSKSPKPGIRPICISDALRRLVAKGLFAACKTSFTNRFQGEHGRALQFGANLKNGATHMFHLINNIAAQARNSAEAVNPITIAALDLRNAFNTLTRAQLAYVLHSGCPDDFAKSSEASPSEVLGYDILWPHIKCHYGAEGILKFYDAGQTYRVSSTSGVQQGDPLGSALFALALHPILVDLAEAFPNVQITAYADNVIISGPLTDIKEVIGEFQRETFRAGLRLNTAESLLHIPSWVAQPDDLLLQHGFLQTSAQGLQCRLSNGHCIPLAKEGLKVLGCPIGSPAFCSATVGQIVADIQNDLLLLQDFQALHQRMKLATYCCNTRSSYLLRAMSPGSMEQYTRLLDKSFDDFTAHTLCFEQDYQDCQHKEYYQSALAQYRLGIKQGGMGMTSLELVAPVAYFVALREFHQWFLQYRATWVPTNALHGLVWLTPPTGQEFIFPHAEHELESGKAQLLDLGVAEPTLLFEQHIITEELKSLALELLLSKLQARPGSVDRLKALAIQSHPARHSDSDIGPELDPDSTNSLSHRPMGLFALLCPYELSNEAFVTAAAILLETPLPHARYLLGNMHTYSHIDVFGDFLLNNSAHASSSRIQSHNCIANLLADLACQHGIPATTKNVPCRASDSNSKGDIVTTRGGLVRSRPGSHFNSATLLVMDYELGHVYSSTHAFKPNNLLSMESAKRSLYRVSYRDQGFAFAPLVSNSLGQVGPDFLRFLWGLAEHAARNSVHVPLDDLPHLDPAVADVARTDFKRLRGHLYIQATYKVLAMLFEGVTERVYGRTFALRGLARDPPSFTLAMASTRSAPRPSSAALSPDAQPSDFASTAQGYSLHAQSPSFSSVMSGLGSPPTRTSLSAQPGRQDLPAPGRIGALANCSGSNVLCFPPPLNPRSCPASGSSLAISPSNHSGPSNSTGSQPGTPRAL